MADPINHPSHYTHATIEPIDVIESWKLGFHLGNAIKYIARCEHKGNRKMDLEKAIWYLQRAVGYVPTEAENVDPDIVPGSVVRCIEAPPGDELEAGSEYVVAKVERGPHHSFAVMSDLPCRYWDVGRFEVIG